MDIVNRIAEIISQPVISWSLAVFILMAISYSVYRLARDYIFIAIIKKRKAQLEMKLEGINAKLEDIKKKLESKREK